MSEDGNAIRTPAEPRPVGQPSAVPTNSASSKWLSSVHGWITALLVGIVFAAFATAAVLVVLRYLPPLLASAPPEPEPIERAWNRSIGRLGIEPVYPPQEDLQVGDVFLVVAGADPQEQQVFGQALAQRAMKIAHISMRDELEREYAAAFEFPETAPAPLGTAPWAQTPSEASIFKEPGARRRLPLIAFPGITIARAGQGGLGAAVGGQGIAFGGESNNVEVIRLPSVETYGVLPPLAVVALDKFCNDHAAVCTDVGARKLLMRSFGTGICAVVQGLNREAGKYANQIEVQMVYRVYLARSIEQQRSSNGSVGLAGRITSTATAELAAVKEQLRDPALTTPGDIAAGTRRAVLEGQRLQLEALLKQAGAGESGAVTLSSSDSNATSLSQTFLRPLAVGFRAVKFATEPARSEDVREDCS